MNKIEKTNKYLILEIFRINVEIIGYCAVIKANSIAETIINGECVSQTVTPYENKDTKYFVIPEKEHYLQSIPYYAHNQIPWEPVPNDFCEDVVFDKISSKDVKAYIHNSYYIMTGNTKPVKNHVFNINDEIVRIWTLISFARTHGKMQIAPCTDNLTGEQFKSSVFTSPIDNSHTFVPFSPDLGELTPTEISAMKDELYVVQLRSGDYSLVKRFVKKLLVDGTKFSGIMYKNNAEGLSFFYYPNGHSRKGYFHNGVLNGPGYLNEDYGMTLGFWKDGQLNSWGIKYYNSQFTFGYWENGKLIDDYTHLTYWIRDIMGDRRLIYKGNMITISKKEYGFIFFGIPGHRINEDLYSPENVGFEFRNNGILYVGKLSSLFGSGVLMRFEGHSITQGFFKNDILQVPYRVEDLQSEEYYWHDDGLFATKEEKINPTSDADELPF